MRDIAREGGSAEGSGFDENGYALLRDGAPSPCCDVLVSEFGRLAPTEGVQAVRGALRRSEVVRNVAVRLAELASTLLGAPTLPTKATFFDKTPSANWLVPWHQDLTITVAERVDAPGFSHWREKAGMWHVQAPVGVLEKTIALRLHLDPCEATNGPLRVIPGTHRRGVLSETEVSALARGREFETLTAGAGDVIAMRPLLVHSSGKAIAPEHRRVLHIEYCAIGAVPPELRWYE